MNSLPNLIIIGAARCGTTALHHSLNQHPNIGMSKIKEIDFFSKDEHWHKGPEWYKKHFNEKSKIRGESSPSYSHYQRWPNVPQRISGLLPDVKIIYLVRDPIERMISHYMLRLSLLSENRLLSDALTDKDSNPYLEVSLYFRQLEKYLEYFNKKNICIIALEDLIMNENKTMKSLYQFLEVDPPIQEIKMAKKINDLPTSKRLSPFGYFVKGCVKRSFISKLPATFRNRLSFFYHPLTHKIERPIVPNELKQELTIRLKDDTNCLRTFTGFDFKNWSI